MADQPTTPSGSRWEPDPDHTPTAETPATPADEAPAAPDPGAPPAYDASYAGASGPPATPRDPAVDDPATVERRAQLRSRAVLAGAATALALGGGLTGFVIGHSTAGGDSNDVRPANFSVPGGNGQLGEGQQVPPSFGNRDGDGDHVGHGPDLDDDGSGSSGSSGSTGGSGTSANPT